MIDADYRGNVGVVLFNFCDADFTSKILILLYSHINQNVIFFVLVKKGDRIAQLICEKIEMADLVEDVVRFSISIFSIELFFNIVETR